MSRIELTEEFYEDEIREGFYVPAAMKQAWAAQIRVFNEIDRVCAELGIKYFADMGTLLGAIRHGGFVPWDDDFDICMLRDDYLRFLKEGVPLLPEGFGIYNHETREDHLNFVANVVAKTRICFEPDHLEQFHGFPYIASIDIFQLDYVSNNEKQQELMRLKAQYVLKTSDEIMDGSLTGSALQTRLAELEEDIGIRVPAGLGDRQVRQFLDIKAEELFASFLDEKDTAEKIVYMMPFGIRNTRLMPSADYRSQVDMPFESGTVPVPVLYQDALRQHYKDYMRIVRGSSHDYPFFEKSRADLQEVLDFDIPEYKVDAKQLLKQADERRNRRASDQNSETYRAVVCECLDEMAKRNLAAGRKEIGDTLTVCAELQQLAIDLGTYMEAVKGEGYDIVPMLEEYCEALYAFSQAGSDEERVRLYGPADRLLSSITETAKRRKEVLFLPYKGAYWKSFEGEYRKAAEDPDTDVYIVPLPYYRKDYLGRLYDMQYCTDDYPDDLVLLHYDDYDYELRHPDVIYIQNPYDDQNIETSLPPFFYSDRLLSLTDRLVYIPWFQTYDFTVADEREYKIMKYYCTMPGVVNADAVILQSETMKQTYIEKLCGFAGEETRELWKSRLLVADHGEIQNNERTAECAAAGKDGDEGRVKTLLYFPDFSEILRNGSAAVEKIRSVTDMCRSLKGSWRFLFVKGRLIESALRDMDRDLYGKIMAALDDAVSEASFELIGEEDRPCDELVCECDAYYGDGGHLAHLFRNAGKPVKIQDYENPDLTDADKIYECADY